MEASGPDGSTGKCSTCILSQPHQIYNLTTEQPSFRTAGNLAE